MSTKGMVVSKVTHKISQKKSKESLHSHNDNISQAPSLIQGQYTNSLKKMGNLPQLPELPKLPGSEQVKRRESKEKFEPLFNGKK